MKKFLKKQITIIIIILLLLSTAVFATNEESQKILIEKSQSFAEWERLSESERKNTIQPSYYETNFKDSIKRSTYNQYLGTTSTDEGKSYNLREKLINISSINVKNQQQTNSCWAFSFSNVIETALAKKYNKQAQEYSPMHIEYTAATTYSKSISEGGNYRMALANGASGLGPVWETDLPFESVYDVTNNNASNRYLAEINSVDLNQKPRARIEDAIIFPPIYKIVSNNSITYSDARINGNSYNQDEVDAIRQLIKNHIMENGAITTSLYTNDGNIVGMYNSQYSAYYYGGNSIPDHAVTIVGWDDNFSKDLFLGTNKPLNNGAYIVLNSWGTEFGDGGYFYVSYDDVCIEQSLCGIVEIIEKTSENEVFYHNIYEYDQLGVNAKLPSVNAQGTALLDSGYAANIFERKSKDKNEYLSEVGVFLNTAQGIEIHVNPTSDIIDECTLVAEYTGSNALEAGYHILKLSSPIQLTGDKFIVKIKYINSDGVYIPIESNLYESGLSTAKNQYDTAVSHDDESFVSFDGITWNDMYNYTVLGTTLKNTNACIKAFTNFSEGESTVAVTGVTLDKETVTIKEGKTSTIQATVLPEKATNKNITWISDNESVATVENGIITGIAEGTATIVVITNDGNFTDECIVTVEKEEILPPQIPVTGVTLDKETVTIKEGRTATIQATVLPENATNKNITWSSSDENIATVANGVITGLSEGTTTITVKTEEGNFKATCVVTVEKEILKVDVTGVELNQNKLSMQVGEKANLSAVIKPLNATNKTVTWTSSNQDVATISETGIIEALKEGKTTISVTTKDGNFTAKCELTVSAKINTDDDIYTETEKEHGKKEEVGDSTTVKGEIPKAGISVIITIVIISAIVTIIIYKKYKTFEDIK